MRSTRLAIAFSLSLVMVTLCFWLPLLFFTINGSIAFNLMTFLLLVLVLMLQFFFFYRLLSSLGVLSSITDSLDQFFYENRCGSLILAILCVMCFIFAFYAASCAFLSALAVGLHILDPPGKTGGQLAELFSENGPVVELLVELLCLISPLVVAGTLIWTGYTAVMGFWRAMVPRNEGCIKLPLGPDEEQGRGLDTRYVEGQ